MIKINFYGFNLGRLRPTTYARLSKYDNGQLPQKKHYDYNLKKNITGCLICRDFFQISRPGCLKFMFSKKATRSEKIFTGDLTYCQTYSEDYDRRIGHFDFVILTSFCFLIC